MSENAAIEIFLRVRPTKKPFNGLTLAEDDQKVMIHIPKDKSQGYVNNQRENHVFAFNGMFNMEAKQNDVFLGVAKDVIDDAFEGYNGTIFAYGQTGSGKTFTMTGGADRYDDRGLIPRTLSYIFQEARSRTDTFYKISVSYIEIYNNEGYDLLDANHTSKNLSDLPKVIPREKPDGTLLLSGLSVHKADDEEKALNLLFIGDTNRIVSETPKNDASTRSHCIFMIQIEGEKAGFEGKKTISRINLVDLSGSERVGKTQVQGLLLTEARFINQSLHFLEQVISVLNKKARGENVQHVPYRNSMMTQILKDSLGGNCRTRMIATISAEKGDIDESICTCNFAMRVAEVKNDRRKNEVMDPALIIQKLKLENQMLKAQIAAMSGQGKSFLDQGDQDKCRMMVEDFISNPDPNSKIILSDMLMIQECFYYFRNRVKDLHRKAGKEVSLNATTKLLQEGLDVKGDNKMIPNEQYNNMNDEIKRLKLLVQQRDNEISILLNLINKQGSGAPDESVMVPVTGAAQANFSVMMGEEAQDTLGYKPMVYQSEDVSNSTKKTQESKYNNTENILQPILQKEVAKPLDIVQTKVRAEESTYNQPSTMNQTLSLTRNDLENMLISPLQLTNEQLKDRAQCWEMFRKSYRKNQAMEENKEVLREKVGQAKQLGNNINNSRNEISKLKNQIEDLRRESAKQGLMSKDNQVMKHPDEDRLAEQIEKHKNIYREGCVKLKDLKAEIENIQTLMERNSQKMQKDFEKWLDVILTKNSNPAPPVAQAEPSNVLRESQKANLNNSVTSNSSARNKTTNLDPAVASNLAAFYKARDEIYKSEK